jgi:hypothetical protein
MDEKSFSVHVCYDLTVHAECSAEAMKIATNHVPTIAEDVIVKCITAQPDPVQRMIDAMKRQG